MIVGPMGIFRTRREYHDYWAGHGPTPDPKPLDPYEVKTARKWVQVHCVRSKLHRHQRSEDLKALAEAWAGSRCPFISHGALIQAMCDEGYRPQFRRSSPPGCTFCVRVLELVCGKLV